MLKSLYITNVTSTFSFKWHKNKKGSTWTLSSAKCSFASLARERGGEDSNTTIAIATQVPVQVSKPTIYFIGKADIFSKIDMVVNRSIIVKAF